MKYRPVFWVSAGHYVGDNGTHYRDCYVKPSLRGAIMAYVHKLLRRRDPFFHRDDYN